MFAVDAGTRTSNEVCREAFIRLDDLAERPCSGARDLRS
jgi:hypothetical protein